ncbi:hypothetical protein [Sphaerotilus sp.]|jgi:Na+/H+-dicarboxylate symporter|nr:hypothetical protein [Sphaerotilus sp.]
MRRAARHAVVGTLVAVALGLVFAAYLQPGLIVDLGNRLWSCF